MGNRTVTLPGTPRRVRLASPRDATDKVAFAAGDLDALVPVRIRVEIAGGRSSTASAMRAARVRNGIEEVGAAATHVELEGGVAALDAEADREQVLYISRLPFVRRISLS